MSPATPTVAGANAHREKLLETAAALFYAEGIKGIGVDRILSEAGTTRATMYRHFPGKEALVAAYLEREDAIIRGYFEAAAATGGTPMQLVEAVIEGIAEDAGRYHRRGCPFINAAAEYPEEGPVRELIADHREWFRATLQQLAADAGLVEPAEVAASLVLLRDAALVGGYLDGQDRVAPAFARTARGVIASHRA